jgi:hypothetical protein
MPQSQNSNKENNKFGSSISMAARKLMGHEQTAHLTTNNLPVPAEHFRTSGQLMNA